MYAPEIGRWNAVDPLGEKYMAISPCVYCVNNPVIFVDVDGREIIPSDANALNVIKNTLPKDAREYVVLNTETGFIDKGRLAEYDNKGGSLNFASLLAIAKNEQIVQVSVTSGEYDLAPQINGERDYTNFGEVRQMTEKEKTAGYNGEPAYNLSTGEASDDGLGGNIAAWFSKSGNLEVVVNANLSELGKVETMAHELYGHADLTVSGKNSKHNIEKVGGEQNTALKQKIVNHVNEARTNYEQQ